MAQISHVRTDFGIGEKFANIAPGTTLSKPNYVGAVLGSEDKSYLVIFRVGRLVPPIRLYS